MIFGGVNLLTRISQGIYSSSEMVSQTCKYAFHILGYLAHRRDDLVRGEEIAAATGVPANYLSKILNQLRKSALVESRKGWGGGFRVREDALERPIRDVVAALDGIDSTQRNDCALGLPQCNLDAPCPLHEPWQTIRSTFDTMLSETRIIDLVAGSK
jgi:Rrf2 family iron-sulfur cluster assembly transcriptional regulator